MPTFAASRADGRPSHQATLSFEAMKGLRHALRDFTALSVREHLRSQLDRGADDAQLTPNEVELVRFAAARSERLQELADRSAAGRE
jgi:hypothetical protein